MNIQGRITVSSKFPCSMIQKKNKEILILPLKAPLQPKKRFAVGLFSNSRKSLFFPSKQIIMKEIAIMTGAKKYERIIERKQKERKAMERKTAWNEYKKKDMKKLEKLNAGYRAFLDHGKTERTSGRRGRIRKPRYLCKRKSCVKTG